MQLVARIEQLRLHHTFSISRGARDVQETVILRLEHEGIVAWGEASPSAYYGEACEGILHELEEIEKGSAGLDPRFYHHLLARAGRVVGRAALSAVDTALHDWIGKVCRLPLHRILGLDPSRSPVSSYTIGIDETEAMIEKLREARGFPIIKVKLGTDRDIEIVEAIRRESGATIRVDANGAWSPEETIEKSRALKRLGVEFIEQPMPPERDEEMEKVHRESALPLIADESAVVPEQVPTLPGRFHGINIKLVKCGGILPARRMIEIARSLGLRVMLGCMIESSCSIAAAAHLAPLADHIDLDGNVLIANDPFTGVENDFGRVRLSGEPGLGVRPREPEAWDG